MGPSCIRRKPKRSRKSTAFKSSPPSKAAAPEDLVKNGGDHEGDGGIGAADDVCSTPKAERFRIPAMDTCPPAPKKRRVMTSWPPPSLRRSSNAPPIAFFAPPDIELFFYFALRGGVSV
nr:cyclin-dependent protein kinase inhibitor SMR9-like [Ipomoea batatas]